MAFTCAFDRDIRLCPAQYPGPATLSNSCKCDHFPLSPRCHKTVQPLSSSWCPLFAQETSHKAIPAAINWPWLWTSAKPLQNHLQTPTRCRLCPLCASAQRSYWPISNFLTAFSSPGSRATPWLGSSWGESCNRRKNPELYANNGHFCNFWFGSDGPYHASNNSPGRATSLCQQYLGSLCSWFCHLCRHRKSQKAL